MQRNSVTYVRDVPGIGKNSLFLLGKILGIPTDHVRDLTVKTLLEQHPNIDSLLNSAMKSRLPVAGYRSRLARAYNYVAPVQYNQVEEQVRKQEEKTNNEIAEVEMDTTAPMGEKNRLTGEAMERQVQPATANMITDKNDISLQGQQTAVNEAMEDLVKPTKQPQTLPDFHKDQKLTIQADHYEEKNTVQPLLKATEVLQGVPSTMPAVARTNNDGENIREAAMPDDTVEEPRAEAVAMDVEDAERWFQQEGSKDRSFLDKHQRRMIQSQRRYEYRTKHTPWQIPLHLRQLRREIDANFIGVDTRFKRQGVFKNIKEIYDQAKPISTEVKVHLMKEVSKEIKKHTGVSLDNINVSNKGVMRKVWDAAVKNSAQYLTSISLGLITTFVGQDLKAAALAVQAAIIPFKEVIAGGVLLWITWQYMYDVWEKFTTFKNRVIMDKERWDAQTKRWVPRDGTTQINWDNLNDGFWKTFTDYIYFDRTRENVRETEQAKQKLIDEGEPLAQQREDDHYPQPASNQDQRYSSDSMHGRIPLKDSELAAYFPQAANTDVMPVPGDNIAKMTTIALFEGYKPPNWPLGNTDNQIHVSNIIREGIRYFEPLNLEPMIRRGGTLHGNVPAFGTLDNNDMRKDTVGGSFSLNDSTSRYLLNLPIFYNEYEIGKYTIPEYVVDLRDALLSTDTLFEYNPSAMGVRTPQDPDTLAFNPRANDLMEPEKRRAGAHGYFHRDIGPADSEALETQIGADRNELGWVPNPAMQSRSMYNRYASRPGLR